MYRVYIISQDLKSKYLETGLNNDYVQRALEVIEDKNILVNLAAKRAGEIARGSRPLVETPVNTISLDVALLEIAEGKVKPGAPTE